MAFCHQEEQHISTGLNNVFHSWTFLVCDPVTVFILLYLISANMSNTWNKNWISFCWLEGTSETSDTFVFMGRWWHVANSVCFVFKYKIWDLIFLFDLLFLIHINYVYIAISNNIIEYQWKTIISKLIIYKSLIWFSLNIICIPWRN